MRSGAPAQIHPVERGTKTSRQFKRVVVGPEVHEEEAGLFGEHVTVQRCDLNAPSAQRTNHGVDFARYEYEIACYRSAARARGLKVDRGRDAHRRRNNRPAVVYLFTARD